MINQIKTKIIIPLEVDISYALPNQQYLIAIKE